MLDMALDDRSLPLINPQDPLILPKKKSFIPFKRINVPRPHCFALSDFHDFDQCVFRFLVYHNLGKKYELAEGSTNQVIGSLLDLAIKKLYAAKAYNQPVDYLVNLIKAAELEMKESVAKNGLNSFYGSQVPLLSEELTLRAKEVFRNYYIGLEGRFKRPISTRTFWEYVISGDTLFKLWGGPDTIEMGDDGVPEVADYKYFENLQTGISYLDMDLMPKIYTFLCADELLAAGYPTARFVIRLWQDPGNDSLYEEFDLKTLKSHEIYFRDKIERILRTTSLSFCERSYCKACQSSQREIWIKQLEAEGWVQPDA